jgi:hypothetical protein
MHLVQYREALELLTATPQSLPQKSRLERVRRQAPLRAEENAKLKVLENANKRSREGEEGSGYPLSTPQGLVQNNI